MVQKGPKGVRAQFADATIALAQQAGVPDPSPYDKREGYAAGAWPGWPFDRLPPECPVAPLGINSKISFFLDTSGQIMSFDGMKPADMLRLFRLTPNYPYWAWPRKSKIGEGDKEKFIINGVEEKKAIACLEKACAMRGLFDPRNRLRGRGAWTDNAGRLIWHSGDALWRVEGGKLKMSPPGEHDGIFYPRFGQILHPWMEPVSPEDSPARQIFDMLTSWTWERPKLDPVIAFGAIGVMLLGAALRHRPHLAAMGDFGVGKSSLQDLVRGVLGTALIRAENATEAGVRQFLGIDCLPVALDEFEAKEDNRRAVALIELARVAFSGGDIFRGGQDHKGVQFAARNAFFCSGINMPPMESSDRSRFAVLNLGKIKVGAKSPGVIQDEWGRMILRALMDAWPQFNVNNADWRATMAAAGLTARQQDTYGTLFAVAQTLLGDADMEAIGIPITEQGRLGRMIADATVEERAEQTENWRGALEHLLASPVDMMHGGKRVSIGSALDDMTPTKMDETLATDAARLAGCKLIGEADPALPHGQMRWLLAVPPADPLLAQIFNDTKWKQGGWFAALKQGPADVVIRDRGNKQVMKINGATRRCLLIDLKAYEDFTTAPEQASEASR